MSDIDTGDVVRHEPSGEEWTVACVHEDRLHWCGWPDGSARLADCTLVRKATPDERAELLSMMAKSRSEGHRPRCARERIAAAEQTADCGGK